LQPLGNRGIAQCGLSAQSSAAALLEAGAPMVERGELTNEKQGIHF
jgi:hypothetical protein